MTVMSERSARELPTGLRARTGPPGALKVRLDCTMTQSRLTTRLRGAREFLTTALDHPDNRDDRGPAAPRDSRVPAHATWERRRGI